MKNLIVTSIIISAVLFGGIPTSSAQLLNNNKNFRTIKNPVSYRSAGAFSDGRGVWLEWTTEVESKNLGFHVYRVSGGVRELVSPFIPGADMQAREGKVTNGTYAFFHRFGDVNSSYVIESLNVSGQRHNSNLIQTRLVDDLTAIAGTSSEALDIQARNANPVITGSESLLPADLAAEVEANRLAPNPVTQLWVAAQPGVKIGIKQEGFYRVTRASLEANGFDINTPTNRWQLYVNGVEQAINIVNDGEYVEFYGTGVDTLESDTQAYYLVVGANDGKRIPMTFRRRVSSGVVSESYPQTFTKKERTFYTQQILNGDAENIFGGVFGASGRTFNFNLSGVDFNSPNASMDLRVQGVTTVAHNINVVINGTEIGTIGGFSYVPMIKHFEFPTSVLLEGANTLELTGLLSSGDVSAFDTMNVNFSRRYIAEQNRLSFHVPNYKAVIVDGFTSENVHVFDTTNPDSPALIGGLTVEQNGKNYRVHLPSNRGRVMYAVEDLSFLSPATIKQAFPSNLTNASNNGELIILSHTNFMTQAEDWANYRRSQGLAVKVVNTEDVYDEFNYGVLSPDSIRNFLQYAKLNWQTKPNYVFLIGDATVDPRNYFPTTNGNFIPTRMFDSIYGEANSDETMGDFNNDGLAEIAVGRIPVKNATEVTTMLSKLMAFEQNIGTNGLSRGAIFAFDLPDGYDFESLSSRLRDQLPSNIDRVMIGRGSSNAGELIPQINQGRFIVNYSGHGQASAWATSAFFGNAQAGQLTNGGANLSIFTMLTCLNGNFVNTTDSLSEALMKNPNGGAVTSWASSGLTTPDIQEVMATRFYNQVAAGNITRIGDLIKDAKTTINFGRDVRLSWVLLGDPMTKVR